MTEHDSYEEKPRHIVCNSIDWRGITIAISYEVTPGHVVSHLQVQTAGLELEPLPFTSTGYRSHHTALGEVEAAGGPVPYVLAWLEEEAASEEWHSRVEAARQGSLF